MSRAASRFRKLPPPRLEPPARGRATRRGSEVGDLFEHFGVTADRARALPSVVATAQPCPGCGWLRRVDELEQPCPLCAAPGTISTDSR